MPLLWELRYVCRIRPSFSKMGGDHRSADDPGVLASGFGRNLEFRWRQVNNCRRGNLRHISSNRIFVVDQSRLADPTEAKLSSCRTKLTRW